MGVFFWVKFPKFSRIDSEKFFVVLLAEMRELVLIGGAMKRIILTVFFSTSGVSAMEEKKPEMLYLRIIATKGKNAFLDEFVRQSTAMRNSLKEKLVKECFVAPQQAELWAHKFIERDTYSTCGLMQGFVGDRVYLEQWIDLFKKHGGFYVMYHDKEPTYERIGLTDVPLFAELAPISHYMTDRANEDQERVELFREALPFFEEQEDSSEQDDEILLDKSEQEKKVPGESPAITRDVGVSDTDNQERSLAPFSHAGLVEKLYSLLLPKKFLDDSDEASLSSSSSSKTTVRYVDHAPSPLCIPACPIKSEEIVQMNNQAH